MATGTGTRRAAEVARELFGAVSARDVDGMARAWDAHTVDDFVALGVEVRGEAALRAFFHEFFTAVPDLDFVLDELYEVDDATVVGQWHLGGTFTGGPFRGIEPTGRRVELRGVDVMQFEGEVLRRNVVYYDGLAFARQVGLLPAADSTADRAMMAAFNALTRAKKTVQSGEGSIEERIRRIAR